MPGPALAFDPLAMERLAFDLLELAGQPATPGNVEMTLADLRRHPTAPIFAAARDRLSALEAEAVYSKGDPAFDRALARAYQDCEAARVAFERAGLPGGE